MPNWITSESPTIHKKRLRTQFRCQGVLMQTLTFACRTGPMYFDCSWSSTAFRASLK